MVRRDLKTSTNGQGIVRDLTIDSMLLGRRSGLCESFRSSESDPCAIISREIMGFCCTVDRPDTSLANAIADVDKFARESRLNVLRERAGKPTRLSSPPIMRDLLSDSIPIKADCLQFLLNHSNGFLLWQVGAGEYGLHALAVSQDAFWELRFRSIAKFWNEELIRVPDVRQLPCW